MNVTSNVRDSTRSLRCGVFLSEMNNTPVKVKRKLLLEQPVRSGPVRSGLMNLRDQEKSDQNSTFTT